MATNRKLVEALKKDEQIRQLHALGAEQDRGLSYMPYRIFGAPVDTVEAVMAAMGFPHEKPVGGSDWMIDKAVNAGLVQKPTGSAAERAGDIVGSLVDPQVAAAKLAAFPFVKMGKITKGTELVDLRKLPAAEGVEVARSEPHLLPSTEAGEGKYVGGPRDIKTRKQLQTQRQKLDAEIAADPRGADWYDRYRAGMQSVTGGDPLANEWMSKQEAQWSAGVSPESELQFALKENAGALMGMPVKAARPAQHQAFMRAVEANDPNLMQLGSKTGEYGRRVSPDQPMAASATGVNDFRHARNLGYTETTGEAQRGGLNAAQHRFSDYETALAVQRARENALGGRTDWTGEMLQAAPWVRQKAQDLMSRNPGAIPAYMKQGYSQEEAIKLAYEDAFREANKTITDFFPKHTFSATYEQQPGAMTQHLPGSVNAPASEREAFAADPRSTWAFAPGNRDALYAGLQRGNTGVMPRVLPTTQGRGMYTPPGGTLETNPMEIARVLTSFKATPKGKEISDAEKAMFGTGELTRAFIDAQGAGAGHKVWFGGRQMDSNSPVIPLSAPISEQQMLKLKAVGEKYGLPDVVQGDSGIAMTNFYTGAPPLDPKTAKALQKDLESLGYPKYARGNVEGIYAGLEDEWSQPAGSGAATKKVLDTLNSLPDVARDAFNRNPAFGKKALGNLERDQEWSKKWGATREDIQNMRRIIGEGPGWIDRLEKAVKSGAVLPAIAGSILVATSREQNAKSPEIRP